MRGKILVIVIALLWLSACAPMVSDSGLYWGKYSHSLYNLKNNPGRDARSKHVAEIHSIIQKSEELKLRVPPGIYAELGMYTLEDGHRAKANKYFNLELSTYPESKAMINQILKKK